MGLFDKQREPIVIKEDSDAKKQLEQLEEYLKVAPADIKGEIEQDIRNVNYGIRGEEALMFELKNSHIPMYILHDITFERNGIKTQIDFLIVTNKVTFILECKNLYGNISIDSQGSFTRTVQYDKKYYKEGIYSPITQNERHLNMISERIRDRKSTLVKPIFDYYFDDNYKALVVIANQKSIIDMKDAPKEIKKKIVKLDGVISYIKKLNAESKAAKFSDKETRGKAEKFLRDSVKNTTDYTEKYKNLIEGASETNSPQPITQDNNSTKIEDTPLYKALKEYRYNQSKLENVKPYFIYNNAQLKDIIKNNPKTIEDLKKLYGFGDVKCEKYGEAILAILRQYD